MRRSLIFLLLFSLLAIKCNHLFQNSDSYLPVKNLVKRVLPAKAHLFKFDTLSDSASYLSAFEISSSAPNKILIKGTDKIAMAKGFYYYLRYYLNANISRGGTQIPLFKELPTIDTPILIGTNQPYRYYLNYCSFNYSMSFWNWEDWEKEIDWMAMQGINLPLAIVGTEAVWQNTMKKFNFTEKEIFDFIPGPAYTAWWLMDNLEGWGGPVSQEWIDSHVALQQKILSRMRKLGMEPVLPAFYGMAPNATIRRFPQNNVHKDAKWGNLQRPAFIDPNDSLFVEIGSTFYKEQEKLYGKANFYSGDPFHEGGKKMGDLTAAAKNIQNLMLNNSPGSTWILQGWQENPTDELLAGTDIDHTLILDLCGEGKPFYESRKSFQDRDFLWCNINNFGNNTYMFAKFDSISTVPFKLRQHKYSHHFKGTGLLMEGVNTDPMMYELFYDVPWENQSFKLNKWLEDYATYRYGKNHKNTMKAIKLLNHSVYNAQHRIENILCARPSLTAEHVTTWAPKVRPAYSQDSLKQALRFLLEVEDKEITSTPTYIFDVANIARQVVTLVSADLLNQINISYNQKNISKFKALSQSFFDLILLTDKLASQMPGYSFYQWQKDAIACATNEDEKELFLWNANRLLTLWSDQEGSNYLHDYAYREWYGLLANFYYPRWELYFNYLTQKLEGQQVEAPDFYKWENNWCSQYFEEPKADAIDIKALVKEILQY